MAWRCNTCNRRPSLEQAEPELDSELEVNDGQGVVTGSVRIANICAECGTEISQHTFDLEIDITTLLAQHPCPESEIGIGWSAELEDLEATSKQVPPKGKVRKTFYGASGNIRVKCNCEEPVEEIFPWEDFVQASLMEDAQ
jgi:hypothetical protein